MTENEAAERVIVTATDGTLGCPAVMNSLNICGRPIRPAPAHDESPVCLMHSRDPEKDDSEFQQEFERILKEATDRNEVAEFTQFIFPSADYAHREFPAACTFWGAIFTQKADFSSAKFAHEADFTGATFAQGASFSNVKFTQEVNFIAVKFAQHARFYRAEFTQKTHFSSATFTQGADFNEATFTQEANFYAATFTQKADFHDATFTQKASFEQAKFIASANFRETTFRKDDKLSPGPVFSLAEFSRPEAILFYKTYLGQALFHNCDVSKVAFSSVEWRTRKPGGRRMLFEEEVDLKDESASAWALKTGPDSLDERDYGLIAELYQQLKKNYDERKDYWAAGDFHFGEMEMKRLHSRSRKPWVRWLHRNLGLVAWYKYASSYGESYLRPLGWLAIVLGIFMLLYPLAGLSSGKAAPQVFTTVTQQVPAPIPAPELSYRHFAEFVRAHPGPKWIAGPAFFGHSLMTTLSVSSLQKDPRYEPVYPWGRGLALLQLLLTSTLIALFLLALRRQFRR